MVNQYNKSPGQVCGPPNTVRGRSLTCRLLHQDKPFGLVVVDLAKDPLVVVDLAKDPLAAGPSARSTTRNSDLDQALP